MSAIARPDSGRRNSCQSRGSIAALIGFTLLAADARNGMAALLIESLQPNVWPGGRGVAVSVSPVNSSFAVVASESGGLFQTADGGTTWKHLTDLPPFRMADVKYSPVSSQHLVATAFADTSAGNRGGIWRSLDGGATWRKPATSNPPGGPKCPASADAYGISYVTAGIFVGTDCGVAISRDSGATWTHVAPDPSAANWRILSVVAHGNRIVDVCGDAGIYRSLDNGGTWGPVNTAVGGCTQLGTHLIDASPLNQDVLFVTTNPNTLFESDDGGRTWTSVNPPTGPGGRPSWVKASTPLRGQPNKYEVFFGNPYNTVRQTCTNQSGIDCAGPWNGVTINLDGAHEPNGFSYNASGNVARFLVTDASVYSTTDGGMTFNNVGGGRSGYNALQVYEVTGQIHPDHTDLFIGTQDNCLWASPDDGRTWLNARCPEGFALQMKRKTPLHSGEVIVGADVGYGNFKSSDHFAVFNPWNDPPNNAGNPFIIDTAIYLQYVQIPSTPYTGIDVTINGGTGWSPITLPASPNRFIITQTPSYWPQIVGPPASPTIYQAVQRRTPAGPKIGLLKIALDVGNRTATSAAADISGLSSLGAYGPGQGSFVVATVFGVDPFDATHVIAPDVGTNEMKQTRDSGSTWTPMPSLTSLILNGGQFLFNVPGGPMQVHSVAFDPDVPGHVLVGTEAAGIFESEDGGTTWSKVPYSDYFIRGITNFFFDRDSMVIVATYGNGLWKLVPGSLPPPMRCSNPTDTCTIDVRTPLDERIYPRWVCPRPPELPNCQVIGVVNGIIEDLRLAKGDILTQLTTNGGTLAGYDIDGKKLDPSLPVTVTKASVRGPFTGCVACQRILKEGGTITGLTAVKDRVIAVIGRFPGPLNATKTLPVASPSAVQATSDDAPYLQLVGKIAVTGQATTATGDSVDVYGSGFCGTTGCSPVTIRVDKRVAADDVRVDEKGGFKATVKVIEMPGHYGVSATQKTDKGIELHDERVLVVPVIDKD